MLRAVAEIAQCAKKGLHHVLADWKGPLRELCIVVLYEMLTTRSTLETMEI